MVVKGPSEGDLRLISFYCNRGPYLGFRINIIPLGESMGLVIIQVIEKGAIYGFES
jgi:hypothetical protein